MASRVDYQDSMEDYSANSGFSLPLSQKRKDSAWDEQLDCLTHPSLGWIELHMLLVEPHVLKCDTKAEVF